MCPTFASPSFVGQSTIHGVYEINVGIIPTSLQYSLDISPVILIFRIIIREYRSIPINPALVGLNSPYQDPYDQYWFINPIHGAYEVLWDKNW